MEKVSYLGCVTLGKITPIGVGDITESIFLQITNADHKDGFLLEYDGIVKVYNLLMARPEGYKEEVTTQHQAIKLTVNNGLTEVTICANDEWKSSNCSDVKELELGLEVELADTVKFLIPTQTLVKKFFNIITAKERNLFKFA